MKWIQLSISLDDELRMKKIIIDINTTDQPSDSKLIKNISIAMLKSIKLNKDDLAIQDLLSELGIERSKK